MKKIILLILLFPTFVFADAVIFSGNDVLALKPSLDLFHTSKVMGINVNPTAGGGVAAPLSSIAMNYTTGNVYFKTGAGNTQWTQASAGSFANTFLSNLTSPTAINQNLLAGTDATFNIGAASGVSRFKDIYASENIIAGYFPVAGGQTFIGLMNGSFPTLEFYAGGADAYRVYTDGLGVTIGDVGLSQPLAIFDDSSSTLKNLSNVTFFHGSSSGVEVLSNIQINDSGSANHIKFSVPSLAGNTDYILPATDGSAGQFLSTDSFGNLSWASGGGGGGANTALSNLASVSINTSLIPQANIDLGNAANLFRFIFVNGWLDSGGNELIDVSRTLISPTGRTQLDWSVNNIINTNFSSLTGVEDIDFVSLAGVHTIKTNDETSTPSDPLNIRTGSAMGTDGSGTFNFFTGDVVDGTGGDLYFQTGFASGIGVRGNIDLRAPNVNIGAGDGTNPATLNLYNVVGTQTVNIKAPDALAATWQFTLPPDAGTASYAMTTDGTGITTWSPVLLQNMNWITSGTAPTATVQASAGTGATCTIANATDTAGHVTITTGTVGVSTGSYCTVTFASANPNSTTCVLTPASSAISTSVYVTQSTSAMNINFAVAGGITTTYVINYMCLGTP